MPSGPRPSVRAARPAAALLAAAAIGLAGCAGQRSATAVPAPAPEEIYRSLLGHNPGLSSLRAVAEARISFAGREVSLPGVLSLDVLEGFRLDLLDPLDRPLAIMFVDEGRIVQYRPASRFAASLAVFPAACRGVDPGDWTQPVLASSIGPVAGERLEDRSAWGGDRILERRRGGELRQSLRYRLTEGGTRASHVSWYCGEEEVLRLRLRDWLEGSSWQLPARLEIEYPGAGLAVRIDLKDVEGNPPSSRQPLRPPVGADTRWSTWNLPR